MNKTLNINKLQYETDFITWNFLLCKREYAGNVPYGERHHIYLDVTHHPHPNSQHGHRIAYVDIHLKLIIDIVPHELFDFTNTRTVFNSLVALHQDFLQAHNITVDSGSILPVETVELPNDLLGAE